MIHPALKLALLSLLGLSILAGSDPGPAVKELRDWPRAPRALAVELLRRYGEPEEATPDWLCWRGRGPFLWVTALRGQGLPRGWGLLQEAVAYAPGKTRAAAVAGLGIGAQYDAEVGTLIVSADDREAAFLALNIAADVLEGRRSPAQARAFYRRNLELAASGKASPYMRGLLFQPSQLKEPDHPSRLWFPVP